MSTTIENAKHISTSVDNREVPKTMELSKRLPTPSIVNRVNPKNLTIVEPEKSTKTTLNNNNTITTTTTTITTTLPQSRDFVLLAHNKNFMDVLTQTFLSVVIQNHFSKILSPLFDVKEWTFLYGENTKTMIIQG